MYTLVHFVPTVYMDNNTVYTGLYALTLNDFYAFIIHKYTQRLFFLFSSRYHASPRGHLPRLPLPRTTGSVGQRSPKTAPSFKGSILSRSCVLVGRPTRYITIRLFLPRCAREGAHPFFGEPQGAAPRVAFLRHPVASKPRMLRCYNMLFLRHTRNIV